LIFAPKAYLKDEWNVLDFTTVTIAVFALIFESVFGSASALKSIRCMRALRPLRMIKRWPSLKLIVSALLNCVPNFTNILCLMLIVYLVFAVLAMQMWAGKFWYCGTNVTGQVDDSVLSVDQCVGVDSTGATRIWKNPPMNFDNIGVSMLTLFEVASLELWLDCMHSAMDVAGEVGMNKVTNNSWSSAFYFASFIVVGSFLVVNLFVASVTDTFSEESKKLKRMPVLTKYLR